MSTFIENKKLTICFLGSAGSIHALKWAKFFSEKHHKVYIISYDPLLENYDLGNMNLYLIRKKIPIQIWPFNTLFNLPFTFFKVKKIIKEIKPDVINAHYVTGYGTLAALLKFHPLVITAWGSDILINPKKSIYNKFVVKYVLKKADLITCDAEHMKESIIKLGAEYSKVKIINFGIDTKKFSPGPKEEKFRKELGIFDYKTVISLRSLEPIYDIGTLIKAIPFILKEVPKTKFLIIGRGSQKKILKKLADDLEIGENVKFLGWIPNEELPKYLRAADIYVSTSLSDGGIAASTAEAMACGLPVIITNSGDNKRWVQDNKNGFIIPIKNPKILAEKTIYLLKNENLGREFGNRNRKIIEEKNDYCKEMAKMENIYYELIKKDYGIEINPI
jgi:glycosyltransferase involved in cell wall biosynthesis